MKRNSRAALHRPSPASPARARRALIAAIALAGIVVAAGPLLPVPAAQAAVDESLPTWDDVQRAKNDEAATAQQITEIETLLEQLAVEVETTRQESKAAIDAYALAEEELLKANARLDELNIRLEESAAEAELAEDEAGSIVGLMYRSGGVDRSTEMFLESDASTSDELLERLAIMEKATERSAKIAENATRTANDARSLGDQADTVSQKREQLAEDAAARKEAAAVAAVTAAEREREQASQKATLDAQLAALKDTTAATVEGYEERLRQEEEARRQNGGGGSPGGGSPPVGNSGWGHPLASSYWVTDEFGGARNHGGIDLAAPEWTPIYAAAAGTVTACYEFSNYGNTVDITHPDGSMTRYPHQPYGGLTVTCGQWVERGQQIGYVGTTGWSTGPHLHFETWPTTSYRVNPRGFMSDRGVYF
ncbi:MAG: peptidoglycan DD-metalloendopeptidase family protein [Leucobacter sp.]